MISDVKYPISGANFGEATISPKDYEAASSANLCAATAEEVGTDADDVSLTGYNDDREVVFFGLASNC